MFSIINAHCPRSLFHQKTQNCSFKNWNREKIKEDCFLVLWIDWNLTNIQTGEIISILINSFRNTYNIKFITNNMVKRIKQLLSAKYDKKEVHFKF